MARIFLLKKVRNLDKLLVVKKNKKRVPFFSLLPPILEDELDDGGF